MYWDRDKCMYENPLYFHTHFIQGQVYILIYEKNRVYLHALLIQGTSMWKSPVYFHSLFIPGEGVIVHLYWATMYAWSNALDKYVKNFDFIVMLWESCTRHCSYHNFDRGTSTQEMSKGLSAHYSEILEYSCVMCEPVVYRTTGSHWQTSAASMLSCLLTSCGFLSRVNFIIGLDIGTVSVWTQYWRRGMRQFWSIRSGHCESNLSFWRWSLEDGKPYH